MAEAPRKTEGADIRGTATPADFEVYFEIAAVTPGTEPWREAIDQLIEEISADLELTELSEQDASDLIGSLLAVREIVEGDGERQEGES